MLMSSMMMIMMMIMMILTIMMTCLVSISTAGLTGLRHNNYNKNNNNDYYDAKAKVTSGMSNKDVLILLKSSLGGDQWIQPWNVSTPLSLWYGVTVDPNDNVIKLSLPKNSLAGSLPTEIGLLTDLKVLKLNENQIEGELPSEIYSIASLTWLNLEHNQLRGTISSSISLLTNLLECNLGSNFFNGTIPWELFSIPKLKYLSIADNLMFGSIPTEISNAKDLQFLYLESNNFTGSIPDEMGSLKRLNTFSLYGNGFSGTLPLSLCYVPTLSTVNTRNMSVCYPECIQEAIENGYPDSLKFTSRCQDEQDFVLCGLADIVVDDVDRIGSSSTVSFASSHPYNQAVNKVFLPTDLLFSSQLSREISQAYKIVVSFHEWTDVFPTLLTVCSEENVCKTWKDELPGVREKNSYTIVGSLANITYVAPVCDGYRLYGSNCWGYQLNIEVYFHTGTGWICSSPPQDSVYSSSTSLSYSDFGIASLSSSFASDRCSWSGVTCTRGKITSLSFAGWSISSATIPSFLQYLQHLKSLDFSSNEFTGTIPMSLALLDSLVTIDFSYNSLDGSLPNWLSSLEDLSVADFTGNSLTGSIPISYGNMNSSLYGLYLASNVLSGVVSSELCTLMTVSELYLSGNQFDCFASCWMNATNLDQEVQSSDVCQAPSQSPTMVPASSVQNAFNALYLIPIIIGTVALVALAAKFLFVPRDVRIYQEDLRKRHDALSKLPIHQALLFDRPAEECCVLIQKHANYIHKEDYDGQTAFDIALDKHVDPSIIMAMLELSMPFKRDKTPIDPMEHHYCWIRVVQESRLSSIVETIMSEYGEIAMELASTTDAEGRSAVSIASPTNQNIIRLRTFFYSQYEILTLNAPHHVSKTCVVHVAIDHKSEGKKKVAMKFMAVHESFLLEQRARLEGGFDPEFVVGIINVLDSELDPVYAKEAIRYGFISYPDCIVMELADRNLQMICRSERVSSDVQQIKLIATTMLRAVQHLHSRGYIHGDVKPLNIVRINDKIKLIDLDAAALMGSEFAGSKLSTAYTAPELIHITDSQIILKRAPTMNSPGIKQWKPVNLADTLSIDNIPGAEANFVLAAPSYDVWALGVVLYELCAGITLFWQDNDDNIDEEGLREVKVFDGDLKMRKLAKVPDKLARNMIHQMLTLDPLHRPTINQLLSHPFLSGNMAARLVGDPPEFDVFISYRVASDSKHAAIIYELLTAGGLKVWWDRKCLKPGLSWEAGFCDGLAKSRIFLPILSRGAINHPTLVRQNFSKLTSSSPCDNVLLEHQLALELREHGLLERIYPVMIGDLTVDPEDSTISGGIYTSYFGSGCHPIFTEDIIVDSVYRNLCMHLSRQCLGTPLLESKPVSSVLAEITKNQGIQITGPAKAAFSNILSDMQAMLADLV